MPLMIVPSHHHSPESTKGMFGREYSLRSPSRKTFIGREHDGAFGSGVIIPTVEALDKILVSPEHDFRWFKYERENQVLSAKYIKDDERSFSERMLDYDDPSCQEFGLGKVSGNSSIGLIHNATLYSECMRSLIEVMGNLPIVTVLQADVFDFKAFDRLEMHSEAGAKLDQEELLREYPYGVLAYPKRIWPEFFHGLTGDSLLRVSHHPDKDNAPHYDAFREDPRFGGVELKDNVETIVEKMKGTLMAIIAVKNQEINDAHERVSES